MKHMITKTRTLSEEALEQILTEARTHSAWLSEPVSDNLLVEIYNLMKWGPTSANSSPARIVFVKSPAMVESRPSASSLSSAQNPGLHRSNRRREAPTKSQIVGMFP